MSEMELIQKRAMEVVMLDEEIRKHETRLKELKEQRQRLTLEELPDLMNKADLGKVVLNDGCEILKKTFVRASLSLPRITSGMTEQEYGDKLTKHAQALQWLRDHEGDHIIRNIVKIEFGKGRDDDTQAIVELVQDAGYPVNKEETVHHKSLGSFIEDRMKNGKEVPLGLFNAYPIEEVTIKRNGHGAKEKAVRP